MAKIFNSTTPAKLLKKQLLSDGFNMKAIGNSLMKSQSPQMCNTAIKHC